jgi:hypothetical protein
MANHGEGAWPGNSRHSFTALDQRRHSKINRFIALLETNADVYKIRHSFADLGQRGNFRLVSIHSLLWPNEDISKSRIMSLFEANDDIY